ncbi:MAG TPA: SCO1664 family protein [Actinomycetota bacterium]|nr:SCO1664 family protein [Actinomycetota bacterium]
MLHLLRSGALEPLGFLPRASNATLLARVRDDEHEALAVYKPRRGESPLWDFPDGTLCLREQAAWVVDACLGWSIVPPTVLREAVAGFGAVQLFVHENDSVDPDDLLKTHPEDLLRIAVFDVLINNADRKAGHLIADGRGKLWGVDHGLGFHEEPKLRTVIWAFAGDPIPPDLLRDLERFQADESVDESLEALLRIQEVKALRARADRLLRTRRLPDPGSGHNVPWPPW